MGEPSQLFVAVLVLSWVGLLAFGALWWRARSEERRLRVSYGPLDDVHAEKARVEQELAQEQARLDAFRADAARRRDDIEGRLAAALAALSRLNDEVRLFEEQSDLQSFGLYEPVYDFDTAEAYKQRLGEIRDEQKAMLKAKTAAECPIEWTVDGSKAKGRTMTNRQLKLMLRAFNGECDAAIAKVKFNNAVALTERVRRSFEAINKLGESNKCSLSGPYLELKLAELRLTHEYAEKRHAEREEQREIQAQLREEERAQRELEKAQQDAEKEERRYQKALEKARRELGLVDEAKRQGLAEKVAALEAQLAEAHARTERAVSQAQLTRSGHVYVISNLGSFGEDVYKIGMTRRLEPMDRVRELGDASVPFAFDVHAMIYAEDAPRLENELHKLLDERRLNLINRRKEFFRVSLEQIEAIVTEHHRGDVEFRRTAVAEEFRQSQAERKAAAERAAKARHQREPEVPVLLAAEKAKVEQVKALLADL
ncbi:MAG: DUF4041 domain-containing protein [Alphaproteobacteria bacterium]|nr:DUF4041 domain-containing protein [Alphaproteobacteria bacterium]